ncbi:MAG: hypothetical protein Q8O22_01115 [Candidatus Omnitrophota bacterium]|nr:hypothetical protein [Candidatus Omnitrophota bacterium]
MFLLENVQGELEKMPDNIKESFEKIKPFLIKSNPEKYDQKKSKIKAVKEYKTYGLEIILKPKDDSIPSLRILLSNIETFLSIGDFHILSECCRGEVYDVVPTLKDMELGVTIIESYDQFGGLMERELSYKTAGDKAKKGVKERSIRFPFLFRKVARTNEKTFNYFG